MFFSVALIHTSAKMVPLLTEVGHEVIGDVELIHMVDEGMQRMIEESGRLTEPVTRRVCAYAMNAQEAGAEAVMLAAPAIVQAIDSVRAAIRVPVVRIDGAMVDRAVQFGNSVGVLAERQMSLAPILAFLRERADARRRDIAIEPLLCEGAGRALEAGDMDAYDSCVVDGIEGLSNNEMIVLADVMMHRVARRASERFGVPVLASPRHGFEDMATKLNYFRR